MKSTRFVFIIGLLSLIILKTSYSEPNSLLEWDIKTDKNTFYPGEPLLLTISIVNKGTQQEKVDFGWNGISAFSFEIYNLDKSVVREGKQTSPREGLSAIGYIIVPPNRMAEKKIVLNRWCSTLLPIGTYHMFCNIDYRVYSEDKPQPNTIVKKAGPIHYQQLETNFEIIKTDMDKFKEEIVNVANDALCDIKPGTMNIKELQMKSEIAGEMLAFAESDLAVPFQLELLRKEKYTWRKLDVINSLVKSQSLEAAMGLVQIIEDPNTENEDVKNILIESVYKLRDTGTEAIADATNDFVIKYKRLTVRPKPME